MSKVLEKAVGFNFFGNLEDQDLKRLGKKLKESARDVRNGRLRKFFTSAEYINMDGIMNFLSLQNEYFYEKWAENKKECWAFLNNEDEFEKAGWNNRKPIPEKLMEWSDKAYSSAKSDIWDVEFEQYLFDNRNV